MPNRDKMVNGSGCHGGPSTMAWHRATAVAASTALRGPMPDVERRFTHWVDLVDHLLRCPASGFPTGMLTAEMGATFGTNASWNWAEADGSFGFEMLEQPPGWPSEAEVEFWTQEALPEHPLLQWFGVTGDSTAMTIDRVPGTVGSRRGRAMVNDCLAPMGLHQQLSIPYRLGAGHRAFVMAKGGRDFSEQQLVLARRIQPLLVLLARNQAVLEDPRPGASVVRLEAADGAGLTARELAVLRLLAEGLTADAIGRRLGVSRHTVRKHLEHLYRKLGVSDRLVAVREARARGLLSDLDDDRPAV